MADNGSIPVAKKHQYANEVITCIKEEGKDPNECLLRTQKAHGLSDKQTTKLAQDIAKDAED